jgi:hypothetical protein
MGQQKKSMGEVAQGEQARRKAEAAFAKQKADQTALEKKAAADQRALQSFLTVQKDEQDFLAAQ